MKKPFHRNRRGTSLAELPMTLWVFLFFLMLPLIDFATTGYRAALAYAGIRDATTKAAIQQTFTDAKNTAGSRLGANAASFSGVSYGSTQVFIVQVDSATGNLTEGAADTPWPGTINDKDVYLIRVKTQATCNPIIDLTPTGTWNGVPGLTGPMTLNLTYQVTAENPQGLIQ